MPPFVHINLLTGTTVSLGYVTDPVDIRNESLVSLYGTCDASTGSGTLTVQVSGDNGTSWFDSNETVLIGPSGGDFYDTFQTSVEDIRIRMDQDMINMTLFASAK